jgi:hypothetical protein
MFLESSSSQVHYRRGRDYPSSLMVFVRAIRNLFHLHRPISWVRRAEYNESADQDHRLRGAGPQRAVIESARVNPQLESLDLAIWTRQELATHRGVKFAVH